ncbi:hypothetical protein [Amycolatopsis sp. NPDC004079]|uniref:hypothetical protein n=1 Tax=Amycolatopsis sp. NPDC004079 TaxID=3154549 RepID=UPI0033B260E0
MTADVHEASRDLLARDSHLVHGWAVTGFFQFPSAVYNAEFQNTEALERFLDFMFSLPETPENPRLYLTPKLGAEKIRTSAYFKFDRGRPDRRPLGPRRQPVPRRRGDPARSAARRDHAVGVRADAAGARGRLGGSGRHVVAVAVTAALSSPTVPRAANSPLMHRTACPVGPQRMS